MKPILYYSEDHNKFTLGVNRPIITNNVSKLIKDIKEKNLLMQFPIVVDNKLKIIDGQHRFLASKAAGLGFYYIKSNNMDILDVAKVNKRVKHWALSDYIYYFADVGNENYLKIINLAKNWNEGVHIVMNVMGASGSGYRGIIMGGTLILDDRKIAHYDDIYKKVKSFEMVYPRWKQRSFIAAVKWMIKNPDYDHSKMVKKLEKMQQKFYRCVNAVGYAKMLEDVYNYRLQGKKIRIEKKYD